MLSVTLLLLAGLIQALNGQQNLTNVALGAYAYNSSAYVYNSSLMLTSFLAVDGKKNLNDNSEFCSLTVPGFEPHWIGVDLGSLFSISYVILYSGTNTVGVPTWNDLDYFIVGVTNRNLSIYPPVRGTYDLCAQYPGTVALRQKVQLNCSSATPPARYVTLQQPSNSTGYMSVCEWEIYGIPFGEVNIPNLCPPMMANLVVDGFHDSQLLNCHCGHANDIVGGPNWFMIDMQEAFYVDFIVFTGRIEYYAGQRSDNFYIGFSNLPSSISPPIRNQYPLCGQWPGYVGQGSKVVMKCNANLPSYRYLIAQASVDAFDGHFAICELEAYSALDNKNSLMWQMTSNVYLNGYQFRRMVVKNVMECFYRCIEFGGCDSINFNPGSLLCEFNRHMNGFSSLTSKVNWSFYVVYYCC